MECSCGPSANQESAILAELLKTGGKILEGLGIDVEKIVSMGFSQKDAYVGMETCSYHGRGFA